MLKLNSPQKINFLFFFYAPSTFSIFSYLTTSFLSFLLFLLVFFSLNIKTKADTNPTPISTHSLNVQVSYRENLLFSPFNAKITLIIFTDNSFELKLNLSGVDNQEIIAGQYSLKQSLFPNGDHPHVVRLELPPFTNHEYFVHPFFPDFHHFSVSKNLNLLPPLYGKDLFVFRFVLDDNQPILFIFDIQKVISTGKFVLTKIFEPLPPNQEEDNDLSSSQPLNRLLDIIPVIGGYYRLKFIDLPKQTTHPFQIFECDPFLVPVGSSENSLNTQIIMRPFHVLPKKVEANNPELQPSLPTDTTIHGYSENSIHSILVKIFETNITEVGLLKASPFCFLIISRYLELLGKYESIKLQNLETITGFSRKTRSQFFKVPRIPIQLYRVKLLDPQLPLSELRSKDPVPFRIKESVQIFNLVWLFSFISNEIISSIQSRNPHYDFELAESQLLQIISLCQKYYLGGLDPNQLESMFSSLKNLRNFSSYLKKMTPLSNDFSTLSKKWSKINFKAKGMLETILELNPLGGVPTPSLSTSSKFISCSNKL